MCSGKIFKSSPKVDKGPSAADLEAQRQAAENKAAEAERQRLATLRGRAALNAPENEGDPDQLGSGASLR